VRTSEALAVTVVIPVHNGAATVARAIDSALQQDVRPVEIIVVDDGSTDATAEILTGYRDRITVLRQQRRGPSSARNAGAAAARARDLIGFLDADDIWHPNMLCLMVHCLQRERAAVLAFCDLEGVEQSEVVVPGMVDERFAHPPSMEELLTRWWPVFTSATVMRRDALDKCGGFSEEFKMPGFEDPYLWLLMREQGPFAYLPQRLVRYRCHPARERMEKYAAGYQVFCRLVEQRYGRMAKRLLRDTARGFVCAWGLEGLLAIKAGDKHKARRAFARAVTYDRFDFRSRLRWLRTFLPMGTIARLSGSFVQNRKLRASEDSLMEIETGGAAARDSGRLNSRKASANKGALRYQDEP